MVGKIILAVMAFLIFPLALGACGDSDSESVTKQQGASKVSSPPALE